MSHRTLISRTARAVVAVAGLVAVMSGCSATEYPAIDSTVTFKTIEGPRIEEYCSGAVPVVCGEEQVPTRYLVEITYPDDPKLFETDSYEYDYYVGEECWIEVKPDVYAALNLGDTVKLGHPGTDSSLTSQDLPSACEIADDLGDYTAEEEYVPGASEFDGDNAEEPHEETPDEQTSDETSDETSADTSDESAPEVSIPSDPTATDGQN